MSNFILNLFNRLGLRIGQIWSLLFNESEHCSYIDFVDLRLKFSDSTLMVNVPVRLDFLKFKLQITCSILSGLDLRLELLLALFEIGSLIQFSHLLLDCNLSLQTLGLDFIWTELVLILVKLLLQVLSSRLHFIDLSFHRLNAFLPLCFCF